MHRLLIVGAVIGGYKLQLLLCKLLLTAFLIGIAEEYHVEYPAYQHLCLSGPCPRKYEHRTLHGKDRLKLPVVELRMVPYKCPLHRIAALQKLLPSLP